MIDLMNTASPLFVSLGLFLLTLIILLAVRSADKNSRNLSNIKRLMEQYISQIRAAEDGFKRDLADIESKLERKNEEIRSLILTCTNQTKNLDTYNEDFINLGKSMQTYKKALDGIFTLTEQARAEVDSVNEDVRNLEELRNVVAGFREDLKTVSDELDRKEEKIRLTVKEVENQIADSSERFREESLGTMDSFRSEMVRIVDRDTERLTGTLEEVSSATAKYLSELDEKVAATRTAADTLNEQSLAVLANIGNRAEEQHILAKIISELEQRRNTLARQLTSFEEQIREKTQVAKEMNELSEIEKNHLANVREEVEKLERHRENLRTEVEEIEERREVKAAEQQAEQQPEPQPEPVEPQAEQHPQPQPEETVAEAEDQEGEIEIQDMDTEPENTGEKAGVEDIAAGNNSDIEKTDGEDTDGEETAGLKKKTTSRRNSGAGSKTPSEDEDSDDYSDSVIENVEYTGEDEEIIF